MSSSYLKAQARCPIQQNFLPRDSSKENLDRFIPNRAAMDFDYAHFALTEGRNETTKLSSSPSKVAYRKQLAEALNLNRTRILAFKNKPQAPVRRCYDSDSDSRLLHQQAKPRRYIPQTRERELDLPDIVDDFSLNLLDWSSSNILAIALNRTVHLWNASNDSTAELVTVDEETGPITSLNWAKDGCYLAVGLNNSQVQLWDCAANREVRRLKRPRHQGRVGSLAWNNHMLTTGGMDGKIINNDVRIRSHVVNTYRGHSSEVCGLKWSESGYYLASGGTDNVAHIWDGRSSTPRLHRLQGHTSAVKGLAWCPFQSSLLSTGGDETIKFWNIHTGACLNSVDAGSQVCSLLWSKKESELLSSHGSTTNQLTLWKYPSMVRMAKLTGHTSPVLYMAQSPDGCTVASASGDETLKTWNVFGDPEIAKKAAPRSVSQPFSHASLIR